MKSQEVNFQKTYSANIWQTHQLVANANDHDGGKYMFSM